MSNREKIFEALKKMSNEQLVENVDFACSLCPADGICNLCDRVSCQEVLLNWLEGDTDGK